MTKIRIAAAAGRDLLCAVGALALGSFYGVERSWLWLLPASAILAGGAWALYRLEAARLGRHAEQRQVLQASKRRAARAVAELQRQGAPVTVEAMAGADAVAVLVNQGCRRRLALQMVRDAQKDGSATFEEILRASFARIERERCQRRQAPARAQEADYADE